MISEAQAEVLRAARDGHGTAYRRMIGMIAELACWTQQLTARRGRHFTITPAGLAALAEWEKENKS